MKKINRVLLQIIADTDYFNEEKEIITLTDMLMEQNVRTIVIVNDISWANRFTNKNIKNYVLSLSTKNPFKIFYNFIKLKKICKKEKIDFIHTRLPCSLPYIFFIKKILTELKLIVSFRSEEIYNNKIVKYFVKKLMKNIDGYIFISNYLLENFCEKLAVSKLKQFHVIGPPVDVDYFSYKQPSGERITATVHEHNIPLDRPIVSIIGDLNEDNGHTLLIEALSLTQRGKLYCLMLGNENKQTKYKKNLESVIKSYNLEEDIIILPYVKDLLSLYVISDLIMFLDNKPVICNKQLLEVCSTGRLVLASNLAVYPELIANDERGWLLSEFNANQLKNNIEEILELKLNTRKLISASSREFVVDNFSYSVIYKKTFLVYKKCFFC